MVGNLKKKQKAEKSHQSVQETVDYDGEAGGVNLSQRYSGSVLENAAVLLERAGTSKDSLTKYLKVPSLSPSQSSDILLFKYCDAEQVLLTFSLVNFGRTQSYCSKTIVLDRPDFANQGTPC